MISVLPNLFVVGAMRAGTTALVSALSSDSTVYVPTFREPHYFLFDGKPSHFRGPGDRAIANSMTYKPRDYLRLYRRAAHFRWRIDASTMYLTSTDALARIAECVEDARIVVLLRSPAQRAFSAWRYMTSRRLETLSFTQALQQEPQRISRQYSPIWHYATASDYRPGLVALLNLFPRDRLYVGVSDSPGGISALLPSLWAFLDLEGEQPRPDATSANLAGSLPAMLAHLAYRSPWPIPQLRRLVPARLRASLKYHLFTEVAGGITDHDRETLLTLRSTLSPVAHFVTEKLAIDVSHW